MRAYRLQIQLQDECIATRLTTCVRAHVLVSVVLLLLSLGGERASLRLASLPFRRYLGANNAASMKDKVGPPNGA